MDVLSDLTKSGTGAFTGQAPAGGSTGQVLTKSSNTDYDYAWGAGGGGSGLTHKAVMRRARLYA